MFVSGLNWWFGWLSVFRIEGEVGSWRCSSLVLHLGVEVGGRGE